MATDPFAEMDAAILAEPGFTIPVQYIPLSTDTAVPMDVTLDYPHNEDNEAREKYVQIGQQYANFASAPVSGDTVILDDGSVYRVIRIRLDASGWVDMLCELRNRRP